MPKKTSRRSSRRRRLHILITAGPTREYFDSVRFISNPSTGKMGYAVAAAAVRAGHEVTLVSGPVSLEAPKGVRLIRVETAAEMAAAAKKAFKSCDAVVLTAAVSDYRPAKRAKRKLPKTAYGRAVALEPTEDIAAALGRVKGNRISIGFAMEDHNGRRKAEAKMRRKNCDVIVLNGPENVGADRAKVEVLVRGGAWKSWGCGTKAGIADKLVGLVSSFEFHIANE